MKKSVLIILFLVFCGLTFIAEELQSELNRRKSNLPDKISSQEYISQKNSSTDYLISAKLNEENKELLVQEKIIWKNNSDFSVDEIFLHLYANGYKESGSYLSKKIKMENSNHSKLNFSKVEVDGIPAKLGYTKFDSGYISDSTVANISLANTLSEGDSVTLELEYSLKIPKSVNGLGYYGKGEFFQFSQWFPQIAVFKEGKWHCSPMYSETDYYSEFASFNVVLDVSDKFKVGASGSRIDSVKNINRNIYSYAEENIHDFAWIASSDIKSVKDTITTSKGDKIEINLFIESMREWYLDRILAAVKNSFEYMNKHFGKYEYNNFTLAEIPSVLTNNGRVFPTLITFNTDLLSPQDLHQPESVIINKIVHQYFYGILSTDQVHEAWIDEAICSYLTSKILSEYYGEGHLSFKLASYYPVNGINFISYNEIPLIYTLGDYNYPEGTLALEDYYKNLKTGAVSDTSFKFPTSLAYSVNTKNKPALIFLTLENYLGSEKILEILKEYFAEYKFQHSTGQNFLDAVQNRTDEDMRWFKENFFSNAYYFDYGVSSIERTSENNYSVLCRRYGDGQFPVDVVLYTDKDTLTKKWDGKETWALINFSTENDVFAAEVDPERINLLDINFANNSYTITPQYFVTFSLSLRWLFWVQNMLMILGSVG